VTNYKPQFIINKNFYFIRCGHCKRLKPEYAKAAELLIGNEPSITLAKVDCTEAGKKTCNKFSVNGYPTLKIFEHNELRSDYNGPREAQGIVKYMKVIISCLCYYYLCNLNSFYTYLLHRFLFQSQVGPASKELISEEAHKAFLESDDVGIIGYFENEDSSLAIAFQTVSKKLREKIRFSHTSKKEILDKVSHKYVI